MYINKLFLHIQDNNKVHDIWQAPKNNNYSNNAKGFVCRMRNINQSIVIIMIVHEEVIDRQTDL